MAIQAELKDALEEGREEIVRVLAEHRVLPEVVETAEQQSSNLLGGSTTPDFEFSRQDESGNQHVMDRQTRRLVIDEIGLASEEECESFQQELRSHDRWGARV